MQQCSTFTKTQYSTRPKLDSIAMIALLSSVEGKSHRRPCQKNVQKEGLEIVATPSTLTTDFLDVELNLSTREYKPYRKPNDNPHLHQFEIKPPKYDYKTASNLANFSGEYGLILHTTVINFYIFSKQHSYLNHNFDKGSSTNHVDSFLGFLGFLTPLPPCGQTWTFWEPPSLSMWIFQCPPPPPALFPKNFSKYQFIGNLKSKHTTSYLWNIQFQILL